MTLRASDDSIDIVSIHPTIHIDSLAHILTHSHPQINSCTHTHTHTYTHIHTHKYTHIHTHTLRF